MTSLRERMLEDMQLHGLAPKTQESYLRAVRQAVIHFNAATAAVVVSSPPGLAIPLAARPSGQQTGRPLWRSESIQSSIDDQRCAQRG
jgi:hypothetical protein